MHDTIGFYIRLRLRRKNITNKVAGASIGLSESAFEKVLTQDDIYASRLVKLSELVQENLFEFYFTNEPIKSLVHAEKTSNDSSLRSLNEKIDLQQKLIDNNEELLEIQRKYIMELELRRKKSE